MRSQGKGREGSQQDPGAGKAWGGCGWSCGREHSDVGAGLRSATGGLWSHLMVQLQPHLRVGVAHGSICGRAGAPLGGVPRASEGQRLGPGDVVNPPSTWDSGGEKAAWARGACFVFETLRREMA